MQLNENRFLSQRFLSFIAAVLIIKIAMISALDQTKSFEERLMEEIIEKRQKEIEKNRRFVLGIEQGEKEFSRKHMEQMEDDRRKKEEEFRVKQGGSIIAKVLVLFIFGLVALIRWMCRYNDSLTQNEVLV